MELETSTLWKKDSDNDKSQSLDDVEVSLHSPTEVQFNKKKIILGSVLFLVLTAIMIGLSVAYSSLRQQQTSSSSSSNTCVSSDMVPLNLPQHPHLSWSQVKALARNQTVNFWMWNGTDTINEYIDTVINPRMQERYNITIVRVQPIENESPAQTAGRQVASERAAGNDHDGSVDMVWINGENFADMKKANNLYGPFATLLPNADNFDFSDDNIAFDFALPTEGYEMPYTGAQFVFVYDSLHVDPTTINSMAELTAWVKAHPGRFTYARPWSNNNITYDYTGSAFIRHYLYEFCGPVSSACSYHQYLGAFNQSLYENNVKYAFEQLLSMEPFLYGYNESQPYQYPDSQDEVDALFGNNDIWITFSYDPNYASSMVQDDMWPSSTRTFVPSSGTIANTNFLAIGYNAKNLWGALVTINEMSSMESQFNRYDPTGWGALEVYDSNCAAATTGGWNTAFSFLASQQLPQTLSITTLRSHALPELLAEYTEHMQYDWELCVDQKSNNPKCVVSTR